MASVVRFPSAPDSSSSHDLTVHVEQARIRRDLRLVLAMIERLAADRPMVAIMMLQWFLRFLSDLPQ